MTEKKYGGRRAYLNDFHKDEEGNYSYEGKLYELKGGTDTLRKEMCCLWGLCIGMLSSLIAAGCVPAPGTSNCFYVLLPYTMALIFGIGSTWGQWRLTAGKYPLRSYIYDASIAKIPFRTMGTILGAGAAIFGEIMFLLRNGSGGEMSTVILFLGFNGAGIVFSVLFRQKIRKMEWKISHTN